MITEKLRLFFAFAHLPKHEHCFASDINDLHVSLSNHLPDNEFRGEAMKKLIEVRDWAIRSARAG